MMFCRHKWKITEKEILPSGIEQLQAAGLTRLDEVTIRFTDKPCIVTFECGKCGAQKVERI